ncbi:hypothetical protein PFICI_04015 [Pestalotiopsis fici W106-1]|uniref:MAPEG family protein n=1 Tax=Pestalotiopsis fici (strain W106-1 / CGMCC3.15140) TaxID=1229662 RepID=W3XIZ5_PESFW|nr:uncharacterized protein PFICI_04015 [Pestalotiopsis fici W106-1]ETS85990.1 hypothetical protein PFICI_04015 [Pestalotiopsis fici W106-1]
MAINYSLLAIPAHWLISIAPHAYALQLIKNATNGRWNNANPRGSTWGAEMQRTVSAEVLARFERAEAAHHNGLENLPFFAAAVLTAQVAGVDREVIDTHAALFLAARVVYTFMYINIAKGKASFARSGIWALSCFLCLSLFVKAALLG